MGAQHLAVPGHGTVFHAAPGTALPANPLTAFKLDGTTPAGWKTFGHTSKANVVSFATEGGETTTMDTWQADNVRSVQSSARRVTLNINALELSVDTLDVAFNGELDEANARYIIPNNVKPFNRKLFVLCADNVTAFGFELPLAELSASGMFSLNPTEFVEVPVAAKLLVASGEDALPAAADGTPGLFAVHFPPLVEAPVTED